MSNSYDELMQDVYDSKDLGSGVINGVECDALAFRKADVDWQIWIAQGERPYPCRFVVTSKLANGDPQYTIQFRDWKFGNDVAADDFAFKNASNAKQVELKDVQDKVGDLPDELHARSCKMTKLKRFGLVLSARDVGPTGDGGWRAALGPWGKWLRRDRRGACRASADAGQRRRRGAKDDAPLRGRRLQLLRRRGCLEGPDLSRSTDKSRRRHFGWRRCFSRSAAHSTAAAKLRH